MSPLLGDFAQWQRKSGCRRIVDMVWVDRRKTRSVSLTPSILSAYNGLFAVSVIMPVRKLDGVGRACVPKGRRRIRTAVAKHRSGCCVRGSVVDDGDCVRLGVLPGVLGRGIVFGKRWPMRSSELASLGAQADALPTFVSTGGTLRHWFWSDAYRSASRGVYAALDCTPLHALRLRLYMRSRLPLCPSRFSLFGWGCLLRAGSWALRRCFSGSC